MIVVWYTNILFSKNVEYTISRPFRYITSDIEVVTCPAKSVLKYSDLPNLFSVKETFLKLTTAKIQMILAESLTNCFIFHSCKYYYQTICTSDGCAIALFKKVTLHLTVLWDKFV